MVKDGNKATTKTLISKGFEERDQRPRKINASTAFETCTEQISPFGGLLGLIKFLDLIKFEEVFDHLYVAPRREAKLGNYRMVVGMLMLLFIGFTRLWHFTYIRLDGMICGFFQLACLPAASTFWRYLDSLGINQVNSFLKIMSVLRERIWQLCGLTYERVHLSTDTTVETLYGHQQGGRKGHNTKNRGKKGYRPVLCFIDETREYLLGKLRIGETISGEEVARFIKRIKSHLPGCVKEVLFRGDGEFFSWESVCACIKEGFDFIIANKGARPPFDPKTWHRRNSFEYNSCIYQPLGWEEPCRFVAMRIPKEQSASGKERAVQCELFEDDRYTYRSFCTSLTGKAHNVIAAYDKRADVENLVGESKREGLEAIPSAKFKNNYAYFQIVMLAFNLWRYFKMMAEISNKSDPTNPPVPAHESLKGLTDNLVRIARLKLLLIGAKIVYHSSDRVKYSIMDSRVPGLMHFLNYLDRARAKVRPWVEGKLWPCRFSLNAV